MVTSYTKTLALISEGVWHTTVVPSHFQLRSYGPEHVVHLCACFVVVVFCLVFDLFLFF